jgi:hypothetical protein
VTSPVTEMLMRAAGRESETARGARVRRTRPLAPRLVPSTTSVLRTL